MRNNQMKYKGYTGSIEWSETDGVFYGQVLGIRSLFLYEGNSIEELKQDFHNLIDEYLQECIQQKIEPEKPFNGSLNVRINPSVHKLAVEEAYERGISLNMIVNDALKSFLMWGTYEKKSYRI